MATHTCIYHTVQNHACSSTKNTHENTRGTCRQVNQKRIAIGALFGKKSLQLSKLVLSCWVLFPGRVGTFFLKRWRENKNTADPPHPPKAPLSYV